MAIEIKPDGPYILEDGTEISGNVLTNDVTSPNTTSELVIKPGSLTNADGEPGDGSGTIQGKYGTLTLNSDGTYTYSLTKDMNSLGAGVDLHDEVFTYTVEWHDEDNGDQDQDVELKIDIHGVNDQVKISDVAVSVYEADGNSKVLGRIDTDPAEIFKGQLVLEDVDPTKDGVQVDLDTDDEHAFTYIPGSVTITSSDVDAKYLPKADDLKVIMFDNGKYSLKGNFDALSEGETATVTFQYAVKETSTEGSVTLSDPKTVTMTIIGTNDAVAIVDDSITTYEDLIDGDIYKSILANDGAAAGIDVNEKLQIISTGYKDIQFWQNGGQISVDNAAQTLAYTPGGGGAISKDHFKFCYQATDGYTDDIGNADVNVAMTTAKYTYIDDKGTADTSDDEVITDPNGVAVDFYQFGESSDDTICAIEGKTNVLSGMAGNDYLEGKEKADILYGGEGQDVLQGGWGDDIYKGGTGNDGIVDTRGNDLYVFSKGDGYDTVDDLNLEIYTDAAGHETINHEGFDAQGNDISKDIIYFDDSVKKEDIAFFQESGTAYDSLKIRYSDDTGDIVSVGWQPEDHYGVEFIVFDQEGIEKVVNGDVDASTVAEDGVLTKAEIEKIVTAIATTDIDPNTAGLQTAQDVHQAKENWDAILTTAGVAY